MLEAKSSTGADIRGGWSGAAERLLTPEALAFVKSLHREFEPSRQALLDARRRRHAALRAGERPDFLDETAEVRASEWRVAPTPDDLECRWVEIAGPVDRKMIIDALNSGADCFMADFEDSLSPTWSNVIGGQANLYDAIRRQIDFRAENGEAYRLVFRLATLLVRPRGWHLDEPRVKIAGQPVSASLFDFGLYFFHNAQELIDRGSGPYFYLPKLENHHEARLWNDVFTFAQARLGTPHGTIRATVPIEHILAAFEMEEILYELKDHSAGLSAGRRDYIFSTIKSFGEGVPFVLPDRRDVKMTVPFMRAFTELLVRTCHRRGAHALGGMAAFTPSRSDSELNERALDAVREDKVRESRDGFDGTRVAHPDLVPVARAAFGTVLGENPHQKDRSREDVVVEAEDLLSLDRTEGRISRVGMELNVSVALQYLTAWLRGSGAVAIYDLMEDTATAEISRAQLWQWIAHRVALEDGTEMTPELYRTVRERETKRLGPKIGDDDGCLSLASDWLDELVLGNGCAPFLTLSGMERLTPGDRVAAGGR